MYKNDTVEAIVDFRNELHASFLFRADATMNLIDALSTNTSAHSPVELSLNPHFSRQHSSLHDALDNFLVPTAPEKTKQERYENQQERMRIIAACYPEPVRCKFNLFVMDSTANPRPFANTLTDRGIIYSPNPAPGNKPIAVGHEYSVLAALPEKTEPNSPPWVLPFPPRRVPTNQTSRNVGAKQLKDLLKDETLPFGKKFSALVADSTYSARDFLGQVVEHKNLATIVRVRGNRKFCFMPEADELLQSKGKKGHPLWYGKTFDLKDSSTWGDPNATDTKSVTFRNGRICQVQIKAWFNILMRGTKDVPMHNHPFTLILITVKDNNGKLVFKNPLWLIIIGTRRHEISLIDAYEAYRQRYDIEHFFRFGKNRLLLTSYQTPDVEHEENWWEIVGLSYVQLFLVAPLAQRIPKPWERYLPEFNTEESRPLPTPSMVQRDMSRIIQRIGTPSQLPKPRGKSPGRSKGFSPGKRDRFPVVMKKKNAQKNARAP